MVEAHGHSTRPRYTRLDLTDPNAQSQGPPDCGQSPDLGGGVWGLALTLVGSHGSTAPGPVVLWGEEGGGGGCWHYCSFHGLGVVGGRVLRAPAVGQGDYNAESTGGPGVG